MEIINGILNDQAFTAIVITVVLLTIADLVMGVSAAVVGKVFNTEFVAEFIRSHVVGRVFPIVTVAFLGHFEPALFALAATASAAYVVETLGSIRSSLDVPAQAQFQREAEVYARETGDMGPLFGTPPTDKDSTFTL